MTAKAELAGRLRERAAKIPETPKWVEDEHPDAKLMREAAAALTEAGAGEADVYPLKAKIWKREGSVPIPEWVLEIEGTINDCYFTARHTEPASTPPEDVASLPSLYASPPPVQPVVKALRETLEWVDTWVSNPVSSYSVHALDGLFAITRERIHAAFTEPPSPVPVVLCGDCPPENYPTDRTRCEPCPRRAAPAPGVTDAIDDELARRIKFGAEHMGCVLEKEDCAALDARVRQQEIVRRNPEDFAASYEQPDDLRAEVDRLRAELDEFKASNALKGKAFAKASARVKALEEGLALADEWLSCVEGHLRDGQNFKRDREAIRALLDKAGGEPTQEPKPGDGYGG